MTDRSKLLALAEENPELVERMVALVRDIARADGVFRSTEWAGEWVKAALEIEPSLPRPVDPDLILAREIVVEHSLTWRGNEWNKRVENGEEDDSDRVRVALAAIKRGRERAQAEALS